MSKIKTARYDEAIEQAEVLTQYLKQLQYKEIEYDATGDSRLLVHIDGTERMLVSALDRIIKNLPQELQKQLEL